MTSTYPFSRYGSLDFVSEESGGYTATIDDEFSTIFSQLTYDPSRKSYRNDSSSFPYAIEAVFADQHLLSFTGQVSAKPTEAFHFNVSAIGTTHVSLPDEVKSQFLAHQVRFYDGAGGKLLEQVAVMDGHTVYAPNDSLSHDADSNEYAYAFRGYDQKAEFASVKKDFDTYPVWEKKSNAEIYTLDAQGMSFTYLSNLEYLDISGVKEVNLSLLKTGLTHLVTFKMADCAISDYSASTGLVSFLLGYSNLSELAIGGNGVDDTALGNIASLVKLTSLDLTNSPFTGDLTQGPHTLKELTALTSLTLKNCHNLTNVNLFNGVKGLASLNLAGCYSLESLSFIQNNPDLVTLHMCREAKKLPLDYRHRLPGGNLLPFLNALKEGDRSYFRAMQKSLEESEKE